MGAAGCSGLARVRPEPEGRLEALLWKREQRRGETRGRALSRGAGSAPRVGAARSQSASWFSVQAPVRGAEGSPGRGGQRGWPAGG